MKAEVQVREEVAGVAGPRWYRGEVDEQWLLRGWIRITDVERYITGGPGSWTRQEHDAGELWLPRESVARLRVRP